MRELAHLVQPLEHPFLENAWNIYTRDNRIVGQRGDTSLAPTFVSLGRKHKREVPRDMDMLDADRFFHLHNHPGDVPRLSGADFKFYRGFLDEFGGQFGGGLVISGGRYAAGIPDPANTRSGLQQVHSIDIRNRLGYDLSRNVRVNPSRQAAGRSVMGVSSGQSPIVGAVPRGSPLWNVRSPELEAFEAANMIFNQGAPGISIGDLPRTMQDNLATLDTRPDSATLIGMADRGAVTGVMQYPMESFEGIGTTWSPTKEFFDTRAQSWGAASYHLMLDRPGIVDTEPFMRGGMYRPGIASVSVGGQPLAGVLPAEGLALRNRMIRPYHKYGTAPLAAYGMFDADDTGVPRLLSGGALPEPESIYGMDLEGRLNELGLGVPDPDEQGRELFYRAGHVDEDPFGLLSEDWEGTRHFLKEGVQPYNMLWSFRPEEHPYVKDVDQIQLMNYISDVERSFGEGIPDFLPDEFLEKVFAQYSDAYPDPTLVYQPGDRRIQRAGVYAAMFPQDAIDYARGGVTAPADPVISVLRGRLQAISNEWRDEPDYLPDFDIDEIPGTLRSGIDWEVVVEPEEVAARFQLLSGQRQWNLGDIDYLLAKESAGLLTEDEARGLREIRAQAQVPTPETVAGANFEMGGEFTDQPPDAEDIPPDFFDAQPDPTQGTPARPGAQSRVQLTDAQRAAVAHGTGRGLVIAGPGSGKTALLRERMLRLVQEEGVAPQRILTLAFNKKAEQELKARAKDIGDLEIRTVHGFANRIIAENLEELGFERRPQVPEEYEQLGGFVRGLMTEESDTGQINERLYNDIVNQINIARANVSTGLFDPETIEGPAKQFAIAYEQFKADNKMLDFQDMLLYAADLMERRPDIRERYQRRFDFIQVDEFQDVSETDWRFIRQLGENILAVGDDDQTIYSFRSGAGGVMHDFADTATQFPVTQNFRSRPEIVDMASQLIGRSRKRLPKELTSMLEGGGRVDYQETTPGTLLDTLAQELPEGKETAVLVPTNYEAGRLRSMLRERKDLSKRVSSIQTLHSSKGLEFERVIMLLNTFERGGGLYRSFPFTSGLGDMDEQLEESRRLFYVGMTRAKDELIFMGRDPKFLYELGFRAHDEISNADIENVSDEATKASRNLRQRMRDSFNDFRSHYQRIRYYQDMVDMERQGRVPDVEIIENLDAAHVHREKIEELGRQLGIEPSLRTERAARMSLPDRILASLHRPGRFAAASYGSLITANYTGLLGGMNFYGRKALTFAPMAAAKGIRRLDEGLYPQARRPDQTINYRELHHPLPDKVRNILPEGVSPTDFRIVKPFVASEKTPYSPYLYEFPHPEEGWMGPAEERPMYHEAGFEMNRTNLEEMRRLNDLGLLTEAYADLDTTESSRNIRITPYDPLGDGSPYQPPRRPRSPEELSQSAIEYLEDMRRHVEDSRRGPRRPSWLRRPDWRMDWERQHRKLLRGPVARQGIDQFLLQNRGRNIVDFRALNKLLTRLNPDRTRVTMGARFGSQDMAGRTIALHNEVLDMLEEVWNPESPYYMPSQWVGAGGKLHDLPGGAGTATDVAPTQVVDTATGEVVPPESTATLTGEHILTAQAPVRDPDRVPGQRMAAFRTGLGTVARILRDQIAVGGADQFERAERLGSLDGGIMDWWFGDDAYRSASLFLETFDDAGKRVRTGSGVYLGDGRFATALHTQIGMEWQDTDTWQSTNKRVE